MFVVLVFFTDCHCHVRVSCVRWAFEFLYLVWKYVVERDLWNVLLVVWDSLVNVLSLRAWRLSHLHLHCKSSPVHPSSTSLGWSKYSSLCAPTDLSGIHTAIKAMAIFIWCGLFVCLFLELLILIVSSWWVKPGPLPLSVFNSSLTFSTQSGVKEWVNLSEAKGPSLCPDVDFWHDHCHVEARAAVSTHNRHSDNHCIYSPAQRQGRAIFVEPSQGRQHAASVSKKSWRHILQHLFLPRSPNRK